MTTVEAETVPREALADALLVVASGWPDQPRALAAARRAIKSYSVQPQRGSGWHGDDEPRGLTADQGHRMVFVFESAVVDGCGTHCTSGGATCSRCRSGAEQRTAIRRAVLAALDSGEKPPAAEGTGTVPPAPQRRVQPRQRPPQRQRASVQKPPARVCENCGVSIDGKPATARYHSDSCRVSAFNRRKRAK